MKKSIRTILLVLIVFGLGATGVEASSNIDRIAGKNRIETAIEVSRKAYPGKVNTVVLAGYQGEVDSLSGTILAHDKEAPMLITRKDEVHSSVQKRIEELGASNIYLLGGENVISKKVEEDLKNLGYNVVRKGGIDRESTAIDVAKEVKGENIDEVFLTVGYDDYADALAINPETGKQGKPIFLTKTDEISPSTKEGLKSLGVKKVTIIGGNAVVSSKVGNELRGMGITTNRVEGENRFDTALSIAKEYASDSSGFLIANGYNYADALIGGYFSINENKPILLVRDNRINKDNIDYLRENRSQTFVLGGESVVKEEVYNEIDTALKEPISIKGLSVDGTGENRTPQKIKVETNVNEGVLYKFSTKHEDSQWKVLRDYGEANFVEWVPSEEGSYEYKVEAKYSNSKYVGAEKTGSTSIGPLKPAELKSLELLGNKYKNTKHTIVAEATSTNDVLYKFFVQDKSTGGWTVLQDYSEKNTVEWTPKKHGQYRYAVRVKDVVSEEDFDERQGVNVTINPPISYKTTRYNYTFEEALEKQSNKSNTISKGGRFAPASKAEVKRYLNPENFLKFNPSSEGHLISIEIKNDGIYLKSKPSSSSKDLSRLKKSDVYVELDHKNAWHKIEANGEVGWISERDTAYINDVPKDMYQFMVLSGNVGVSPDQLNKYLKGMGILEGKGASFAKASKEYNVNELYLIAHSLLETGKGTSSLSTGIFVEETPHPKLDANGEVVKDSKGNVVMERQPVDDPKTVYNMYGIRAVDNDADRQGSEEAYKLCWDTPEKAIVGGAKWISDKYINGIDNQDTLYKMRYNPGGRIWHQYATDVAWGLKQTKLMDSIIEISNDIDDVVLRFDIPQYK